MTKYAQRKLSLASGDEAAMRDLPGQDFPRSDASVHRLETQRGALTVADATKRVVDICGAIVGILLFGPLMATIAILIIATENGEPLFAHERVGRNGRRFRCLKFRTMAPDAQQRLAALLESDAAARAEWARDQKLRNDPRVTPLGAFLRRTSLDELPQFFNVLRGDMSLVGPRPIVVAEIERYGDRFALYAKCRPGITGIWQVSGRNDISYDYRVRLDAYYALNQRLSLDILIMLKTFGVVISGDGAR
jgi:Undecaprenyl-phosphate galactose phosphotransferase WbaP